ncbi:MAG: imidazole glycerol phosphate synthase subunit HisF [Phycisphaerae bacterium]
MLKTRVIPVVLLRNGIVVQSKGFKRYQLLGNPTTVVQRLSDWASDELIYLDITQDAAYDLGRDDLKHPNRHDILEIVSDVARRCFMPLTFGGRIQSLADGAARLQRGADKIAINTRAVEEPKFITECAQAFGSQCVVVSIDVRASGAGRWEACTSGGRIPTGLDAVEWARAAEQRGAGEILLNSIDRDGSGRGYDLALVCAVVEAVSIPVIALGGVGDWSHFADVIRRTNVSAVAAANIFHYSEQSVYKAKKYLFDRGFNVRQPELLAVGPEEKHEPCATASDASTPR